MASRPIMTSLKTVDQLSIALDNNPGVIIIKLGATWCAPCQVIESTVKTHFSKMPHNVQCYAIDVDDNFELYGQLKKKKIVKGIPALLAYNHENNDGYPDDFYSGTKKEHVQMFFQRCNDWASKL